MSTTVMRLDTFETLRFDAVTQITIENGSAITEHPVEDAGTVRSVTDHAQKLPRAITISGVVTDTPIFGSVPDAGFPGRARQASDFLDAISGVFVSVQTTKHGTFSPCLLQGWPVRDEGPSRLAVDATFREVEVAEVGYVDIPPEITTATGLVSAKEGGEQPTTTLPDDAATQGSSSILLGLLQGIGIGG